MAAALSYNHASTWTGSHLTRKCLLLFSLDFTKESSSMIFSYRRQRWPGTMPLAACEVICRGRLALTVCSHWSASMGPGSKRLTMILLLQISSPQTSSCVESADGYRHVIFGRRSNPTGPWREYGPSMLRVFRTKRYTGASFSKTIQKSLVGLKIRIRDQMHTGSGSSGNAVEHGLRSKLLRSFRANGSALCVFKDWIRWMSCHGNGLTAMV